MHHYNFFQLSNQKITEYKLKLKTKPWIITAVQKSISIKNKIFKKLL